MGALWLIACKLQVKNLWIASISNLALDCGGKIDNQSWEQRRGTAFALPGGLLARPSR